MHVIIIEPGAIFQALSDSTRIRIVRLLASTKDEACLCELAESLDEPEYKLSRHVKLLRQAGLISSEKEGRWIYHRLIKSSPQIGLLHKFIRELPDDYKQFRSDYKRFEKRKKIRTGNRCRTGNSTSKIPTKMARS